MDHVAPTVTIDASALTSADTWQPRSGILRFKGTSSDSVGLAAVQVRVDEGEFVDAIFGDGGWRTALVVPDPEGRTITVTVRAIDRAGRSEKVTRQSRHGAIRCRCARYHDQQRPRTAKQPEQRHLCIHRHGECGVFECQLDDGVYQPCASPQQYAT